jgi:hypothetical protein
VRAGKRYLSLGISEKIIDDFVEPLGAIMEETSTKRYAQ